MEDCFCCNEKFNKDKMNFIAGKYACSSCFDQIGKTINKQEKVEELTVDQKIDRLVKDVQFCKLCWQVILGVLLILFIWSSLGGIILG